MFRNANYIYTVYQERNFSRAAEKLFISQSSLSLTIKKAEERIGAPIFNRSVSPIGLTEFGKKYIAAVEEMRRIQNRLENDIYEINHLKQGHLSVGAGNFHSTYLLPLALSPFREAYPKVLVDMHESTTQELRKKLDRGEIDLLFSNKHLPEKQYRKFVICHEFTVLVVPEKYCTCPEIRQQARTREELSRYPVQQLENHLLPPVFLTNFQQTPFVLLRPGNNSRQRADTLFLEAGFQPSVVLELDQASTAYRLAASGLGAAIVSNLMVRTMEPPQHCCFFPLEVPHTEQYISVYFPKEAIMTKAMEEFIKIARIAIPAGL